ncbi:MAG: ABC transporter ATP-binding protein [Mariniblastus sp.]
MNIAIETTDLTKNFDDFCAVQSVNLNVQRGSLYGFLGPNGAGKSTTIKMLTGILSPSTGSISLLGGNPWVPSDALQIKKRTGVVPEDLALFDNLTAREYMTFIGRMHLMESSTIINRTEELLNLLKLEGVETKLVVEYSHGMKKKLALAAALLPNPDLLFLDEPFEGVDAVTARVIRDLLATYVSRGSTVFVTSHVLEIVERICTHVGIIANGQLVEQTSLDSLRQGNSLEKRFLELVGNPDAETANLDWLDGGQNKTNIKSIDVGTETGTGPAAPAMILDRGAEGTKLGLLQSDSGARSRLDTQSEPELGSHQDPEPNQ